MPPAIYTPFSTVLMAVVVLLALGFPFQILAATTSPSKEDDDAKDLFSHLEDFIGGIVPLHPLPPKNWRDTTSSTSISSSITTPTTTPSSWKLHPTPGTTWNIQLSTVPSTSLAQETNPSYEIWDFDMADASPSTIAAFQTGGNHSVICYFSAGSREEYRADAGDFPQEAVGKVMQGWERERWVDTRSEGVREVMRRRIEEAAGKGCGGVDADNIDGYSNDSGFDLTADDAVDFVRFLAHTTHEAGMAFGLKNGGDIVERVVDVVEWCVQEECVRYGECGLYRAVIEAGKPVFHIEYVDGGGEGKSHDDGDEEKFVEEACKGEGTEGFSTLVKKLSLDGWTRTCSAP